MNARYLAMPYRLAKSGSLGSIAIAAAMSALPGSSRPFAIFAMPRPYSDGAMRGLIASAAS